MKKSELIELLTKNAKSDPGPPTDGIALATSTSSGSASNAVTDSHNSGVPSTTSAPQAPLTLYGELGPNAEDSAQDIPLDPNPSHSLSSGDDFPEVNF